EAAGLNLGVEPLSFWSQRWLTIAVILGLALVNVLGVRWGGLLQLFITSIKVASLIAIALLPFLVAALARSGSQAPTAQTSNLQPVWPALSALDIGKLGAALVGV